MKFRCFSAYENLDSFCVSKGVEFGVLTADKSSWKIDKFCVVVLVLCTRFSGFFFVARTVLAIWIFQVLNSKKNKSRSLDFSLTSLHGNILRLLSLAYIAQAQQFCKMDILSSRADFFFLIASLNLKPVTFSTVHIEKSHLKFNLLTFLSFYSWLNSITKLQNYLRWSQLLTFTIIPSFTSTSSDASRMKRKIRKCSPVSQAEKKNFSNIILLT
jgi:hypothetical protein